MSDKVAKRWLARGECFPLCNKCQRYIRAKTTPSCAAYPAGIPMEILTCKADHHKALPNDHGIRFEATKVKGGPGSGDFGHGPQGDGLVGGAGAGGGESPYKDQILPHTLREDQKDESNVISRNYDDAMDRYREYAKYLENSHATALWIMGASNFQAFVRDKNDIGEETEKLLQDDGMRHMYAESVGVLLSLLDNAPQYEGSGVRGIGCRTEAGYDRYSKLEVGNKITDKGFMAMTADPRFAAHWAEYRTAKEKEDYTKEGKNTVMIYIENAKGIPIDKVTTGGQREVLMKPGTTLEITSRHEEILQADPEHPELFMPGYPTRALTLGARVV